MTLYAVILSIIEQLYFPMCMAKNVTIISLQRQLENTPACTMLSGLNEAPKQVRGSLVLAGDYTQFKTTGKETRGVTPFSFYLLANSQLFLWDEAYSCLFAWVGKESDVKLAKTGGFFYLWEVELTVKFLSAEF